jgi:hypothetical protein
MQLNEILSFFASLLPTATESGGGGERDRTDDLLRAKQVLSQLSYTPTESKIVTLQLKIQWWA